MGRLATNDRFAFGQNYNNLPANMKTNKTSNSPIHFYYFCPRPAEVRSL